MALQELDNKALVQQLVNQEHALVRARFSHSTGRLENTASLSVIRKEIARLRTEIRVREQKEGLGKNSLLSLRAHLKAELPKTAASSGTFLESVVDEAETPT